MNTIQKEIRAGLITKIKCIRAWGGNPDDPLSPEDDVADILRYLDRKNVVIQTGQRFISTVAQFRTERLVEE